MKNLVNYLCVCDDNMPVEVNGEYSNFNITRVDENFVYAEFGSSELSEDEVIDNFNNTSHRVDQIGTVIIPIKMKHGLFNRLQKSENSLCDLPLFLAEYEDEDELCIVTLPY